MRVFLSKQQTVDNERFTRAILGLTFASNCRLSASRVARQKIAFTKLGEKHSQRLAVNSILWIAATFAGAILSSYLIFIETF